MGEFSWWEVSTVVGSGGRRYLFEPLCKVVERVDDTVIVDDLVCIDRVVATAGTQDAVDQLCLGCSGTFGERVEKVLRGGLKRGRGV